MPIRGEPDSEISGSKQGSFDVRSVRRDGARRSGWKPAVGDWMAEEEIEELEEQINTLLDEIGDDEPTEEQAELLAELTDSLEMVEEIYGDLGEGLDDDMETRRERLIDNDPVILEDGDVDTWERWTQDYQ